MVRDPFADEDAPDLQDVLDALEDPDCRAFVRALEEPMTASELSEACDVPLSTTYRKLDLLTEASLLGERTEIRKDGQHTTRYAVEFEGVRILLGDDREFVVRVDRPERTPDQRLADMWTEVRKET
ncbi:transcriptional regulator [Halobacteriales archaeon QS_8_69_26]|nr:MAG: transcriptional regulator [Halobacteriales archaeon QS_8_69_26]